MTLNHADAITLAANLRAAAAAYYDTDVEVMSDAEYDEGIEELRTASAEHPSLAGQFDDLLNTVAGGQSAGGDVEHGTPMASLDKVVGLDAVRDFVTKVGTPVVVEPKLDGLPISVMFRNGILTRAATRGDGTTGEDVTAAVKNLAIQGLPQIANAPLTDNGIPASFEVRGEVFLADADFPRAQDIRASLGGQPFKNQRNSAAGILRKGDAAYAGILTFSAFDATFASLSTVTWSHDTVIDAVERSGIKSARSLLADRVNVATTNPEQVIADIAYMGDNRATLGFPIDGAVIKAATPEGRMALGDGTRAPRWAMAFKYPPLTALTTVVTIHETVGKTGRLGLQIELVPVHIDGSLVTFTSGHNVGWIEARDVRIGDTVMMMKRGDVIPYLDHVIFEKRPTDAQRWLAPETDPMGEPWDKSTKLWRSTSPELSVVGAITYSVRSDVLDVDGLGVEIATALVDQDIVRDIADLFILDIATLANLPLDGGRLVGTKVATKVIAEVQKAKGSPWARVITALSLRGTGRSLSRRIASSFPTMDGLLNASLADLALVDGIGTGKSGTAGKAATIRESLDNLIARGVPARLAAAGVNMGTEPNTSEANSTDLPLAGMTVVISGSVPGLSRTEANETVEANGGKSSSSVSKTTSLLVSEPSTSSKYVKAQQLGVKIVEPAEFLAMIGR